MIIFKLLSLIWDHLVIWQFCGKYLVLFMYKPDLVMERIKVSVKCMEVIEFQWRFFVFICLKKVQKSTWYQLPYLDYM